MWGYSLQTRVCKSRPSTTSPRRFLRSTRIFVCFRGSMWGYTLQVDTRPTTKGATDLHQAFISGKPFVKVVGAPKPPTTPAVGSSSSSRNQKQKAACRFYLTDKRSSKGGACTLYHAFTRKCSRKHIRTGICNPSCS